MVRSVAGLGYESPTGGDPKENRDMMPDRERALRQEVIDTCLKMNALGINQGTSGNASVRVADDPAAGFFITPSAIPSEEFRPEAVVRMELDGGHRDTRRPPSRWHFPPATMSTRDARAHKTT